MRNCPNCAEIRFEDDLQYCPVCGSELASPANDRAEVDGQISLYINFTVVKCDCGSIYPYTTAKTQCHKCGKNFTNDNDTPFVAEDVDPIVAKRRQAIMPLTDMRFSTLDKLGRLSLGGIQLNNDDYLNEIGDVLSDFSDQTESIRYQINSMDFSEEGIESDDFHARITSIQTNYESLFEATKRIWLLSPPPTWETHHRAIATGSKKGIECYLDFLELLTVNDFSEAQTGISETNQKLAEASDILNEKHAIIFAGKTLRHNLTETIDEAIASLALEETGIVSWQKQGWSYFENVFRRKINVLPSEQGFTLALYAIIAESFDNPPQFLARVDAIADMLRQADAIDRVALVGITNQFSADYLHAARLLFNVGRQLLATDFSQLHSQQVFDIAIHAYQRMSEGTFKHLLNLLLFAEDLIDGNTPNYDDISKRNFGGKVRRYKSTKPKGIADFNNPNVADIADDLVMYVRHADAHCDFDLQQDKLLVQQRDHRTKAIIATHTYTDEQFTTLIQQLLEAVSAIMVGILCFRIEQFEQYLPMHSNDLFDYEKMELGKCVFATYGIIVEAINLVDTANIPKQNLQIRAKLVENLVSSPSILLPPLASIAELFPNTIFIEVNLQTSDREGTITVPTKQIKAKEGTERQKQLRVMGLTYQVINSFANPSELLLGEASQADFYFNYVLNGGSVYLAQIIRELLGFISADVPPSKEVARMLKQDLVELRKATTHNPPNEYLEQHTKLQEAVKLAIGGLRPFELWIRSGNVKYKTRFENLVQRPLVLTQEILEYVIANK